MDNSRNHSVDPDGDTVGTIMRSIGLPIVQDAHGMDATNQVQFPKQHLLMLQILWPDMPEPTRKDHAVKA